MLYALSQKYLIVPSVRGFLIFALKIRTIAMICQNYIDSLYPRDSDTSNFPCDQVME